MVRRQRRKAGHRPDVGRWTSERELGKIGEETTSSIGAERMGRNIKEPPKAFLRNPKILAANVLRLRENAGLSQAELAAAADLKRQALLSDIERCTDTVNPTLETLCRLAEALKVDMVTLLFPSGKGLSESSAISRKTISLIEADDAPPDHPKTTGVLHKKTNAASSLRSPASVAARGAAEEGLQAEAEDRS